MPVYKYNENKFYFEQLQGKKKNTQENCNESNDECAVFWSFDFIDNLCFKPLLNFFPSFYVSSQ